MARHWMEIAVVVEQRRAVLDAPSTDQKVNRFVNGDPTPA